jgi:phenylalanyl-tRNA synthetase beta chain
VLGAGDGRSAPVALANPMSAEQAVMRTTLVPGLLATVRDNLAHQNYPLALFEQGRVYRGGADGTVAPPPDAAGRKPAPVAWPAAETEALGVVVCGPLVADDWTATARETGFYSVKGIVERVLVALAVDEAVFAPSREPYLHPGKSADLLVGAQRVASLGLVRPDVALRFGIEEHAVHVVEMVLDPLVDRALATPIFEDLVTYPSAVQDVAVVIDAGVPAARVVELTRTAGGKLLREAWVFDVYEGDQVPQGKRSLALRLVMRSPERTLTEKDIATVRVKVLTALERELGAALR